MLGYDGGRRVLLYAFGQGPRVQRACPCLICGSVRIDFYLQLEAVQTRSFRQCSGPDHH